MLIQFNTQSCRLMWKGRETQRFLQQSRSAYQELEPEWKEWEWKRKSGGGDRSLVPIFHFVRKILFVHSAIHFFICPSITEETVFYDD